MSVHVNGYINWCNCTSFGHATYFISMRPIEFYVTLHDSWISIGPYKICAPITSILVKPHDMNSCTLLDALCPMAGLYTIHYTVHNIHDHIDIASVKNTFFFLLFVCQHGLPH